MNVHVEVIDNSDKVKEALETQLKAALEACGLQGESYAKENITAAGRVDTGNLRNSISHSVSEDTAYIGTNVEYAVYHEMGTGIYAEGGGGRQTPWFYVDRNGEGHYTRGIKPTHFLKDAVANHREEYERLIETHLKR